MNLFRMALAVGRPEQIYTPLYFAIYKRSPEKYHNCERPLKPPFANDSG